MSKPLSPQAQAVRRDFAQIMKAMHPYTDVKVSVSDFALPIKIDGYRAGIEAGVNALVAAALRDAAEQMPSELPEVIHSVPEDARRWYRLGFQAAGHTDRSWLSAIAAELEAGG